MNETSHRPIRSFVMRAGRMTVGQARALEELWPRYGVEYSPAPVSRAQQFRPDQDMQFNLVPVQTSTVGLLAV